MSRHSRPNTPLRIALAVISVLLIVVLMAVTLIYRPSWLHVDTPTVERSSVGRTVSPRQRQTYCPSRMTIADADAYGDSEYRQYRVFREIRRLRFGVPFIRRLDGSRHDGIRVDAGQKRRLVR